MYHVGNMTGFEPYPGLEYMNEYNNTGMLHLKYKNMNQTEVPQMNFAKREDKLNINIVNNLDLDNMIRMNNIEPLKNISGNLICQEIKEEDFEDQNLPKLLKVFQYSLEYLNAKRMKLVKTNEKLHIEYEQLINQSLELEKKLKENKNEITRNKSKKKEHELLLLTYESLVNFNCNPTENTNIIMKNIKTNYGLNVTEYEKNISNKIGTYPRNERFYCHICNGKYFNTERGLENHMKRRHLAQIRQNSEKEKEEMKAEEIQELYDKKLEETKNHFQNLLMQKNDIISKANLEEEINMIKRETNEKYKLIMESNNNFKENMGNILKDYKMQQDDINQKLLNLAKTSKENQENKEVSKVTVNQINNLINSIENMTETFKQNKNNNNENNNNIGIIKDIKEKSKDIQNLNSIKYDYNINYTNNNANLNNNHINDDNNINNNNINNDNNKYNQKSIINKEPQNTFININKNVIYEKEDSFNKENNNNINNNNNLEKKEENNEGDINKNIKKNIISQGDFISNNDNNFKELNNQGNTINNNFAEQKNNEEEINISKLAANNKILESNIEFQNNEENENNKNNILLNQKGNELGSIKEDSIKEIDVNNNKKDKNDSFSKTDPNAFKKNEDNFEPFKTFTNNDKLINFAREFRKRDNPILDKKEPDINDINGFSKEIIADKNFKTDLNMSENVENFIENNAENKNFERIKDLDKKNEGELLNIIKNTLNNINKINEKSKVAGLYFETMNKLIDFKMLEKEEEMMREAYNQKGVLKRTRSKSSKASIVIKSAEDDIKGSENLI